MSASEATAALERRHRELIDALDKIETAVKEAQDVLSDGQHTPKEKVARAGVILLRATIASEGVTR